MGSTDNAAASTAAKVSSNAGTGFGNSSGGEFDTSPTPSSGLSGSVGIGGANAPSDIFQVSSALTSNGLMDAPQNTADSTLYSGIISAQESMGSDLKPDGLVNPDGPTQQTFNKLSDQGFVKAPAPAAPPPPLPPLPQGEGRGEGSSTATILSDETIQSNQRLADNLKKRTGVGDLPKFTSDAINTDGDKAIPEIVNLLHEVEDPAQARELYQRTLDGITPEHQEQFEDAYTLSLSGGEEDESLAGDTGDDTLEDDLENSDNTNDPLKVTIRPNVDNEINPMDGASGLHGKDFDAQKQAVGVVDDLGRVLDDDKPLTPKGADAMKTRIDETFPHDEDAHLKAKAIVDAARTGNTHDTENALRDLRAQANDPKRLAAQRESREYYQAYPEGKRLEHADQRGKVRGTMEQSVQNLLINRNGISEQDTIIEQHGKAAENGNANSKQLVDGANAKKKRLELVDKNLTESISKDTMAYQSIPTHPQPEIDKRGGRQEEAAENRNRTQKELATDVALTAVGLGVAGVGRKVAGRAVAAAGLATADAATTYTRALQEGTRAAMRDSGVDFTDPKAVASWAKENPGISR